MGHWLMLGQQGLSGGDIAFIAVYLAVAVLMIAGLWKTFTKAGEPGWASIIPIFNTYILLKIAGRPWWWLILFIIPIVSLIIWVIVCLDLSKSFGKGVGFAVGLFFLPFIFFLILGFGSAQYQGPAAG